MEEVKRNDLIFFRNEVLEDIKKVEMNINDKIVNLAKQLQNANLINEQKFGYYQDKYDEMLIKLDPTEFQNKIKDKINKFGQKIEEVTINNNVKIQKIEKDLANSCYKYDKIYLKNMSSPGLIGDGCPYPTMKSFFIYLDKKIKQIIGLSDKTFKDFNSLKIYLDKAIEDFVKQIDKNAQDIDKNNTEKLIEYEKKLDEKKKYLEDRFEHIRIENSQYIYGIIKSQEIINERLKVELKKYSLINESLIKYYTNKNKTQKNNTYSNNKNELNKKTKSEVRYIFNTKSSKKMKSKIQLNLNEILPAVKKIEENFNFNEIIYKNKDLKELKLRVEDNAFEIDNQRKDSFHKNILKTNKSLFLRRSTMGTSNNNPNRLYTNFHLFNNDTYKTIFHSNKNNLIEKYKTEEKKMSIDEDSKSKINIQSSKNTNSNSEKKLFFDKIIDEKIIPIISKKSFIKEEQKEIKEKSNSVKKEYKNKITITSNEDKNKNNENDKDNEDIIINNNYININKKNKINEENYKKKVLNENKDDYDKTGISFKLKEEKKEKEILVKEYDIMKENKNDIKNKNHTISYLQTENTNKNLEIRIDKKIDKMYKFINRNNDEINKKLEILNRQINYLLKEILQILKDKKKLKNSLTFDSKDKNNAIIGNLNLNNLYISNNSIIPIKSYELKFGKNEKSHKLNSSDNNIKKLKNNFNRIINIGKNNNNENYGFVLNKIEPYLIKKFQNA